MNTANYARLRQRVAMGRTLVWIEQKHFWGFGCSKSQIVSRTSARLWKKLRGQRERSAWSQAYWPAEDYIPPSFNGRITLFKDPKQPYYYKRDPLMGWGDRARGGVDLHVLPIGHSAILREPTVQVLAKRLVECLQNAYFLDARPMRDEELVEVSLASSTSEAS